MLADALSLRGNERVEFLATAGPRRAAATAERPAAPGELPPAINDLAGRDGELTRLSTMAARAAASTGSGPVVCVLHGPVGIGKTSLAVRAGHRHRAAFPDGQLFVDLLREDGTPLDTMAVLGRFLRSLGTPDSQLPATEADAAAELVTLCGHMPSAAPASAAGSVVAAGSPSTRRGR